MAWRSTEPLKATTTTVWNTGEDAGALAAGAHQAAEAQLGEMLGDRRRPGAEVIGEPVDGALAVEERPRDPHARRVSDHGQDLDGASELLIAPRPVELHEPMRPEPERA